MSVRTSTLVIVLLVTLLSLAPGASAATFSNTPPETTEEAPADGEDREPADKPSGAAETREARDQDEAQNLVERQPLATALVGVALLGGIAFAVVYRRRRR